jgi:hypothetical protein
VLQSQVTISGSGVKKAITYMFSLGKKGEVHRKEKWNLFSFKSSEYE